MSDFSLGQLSRSHFSLEEKGRKEERKEASSALTPPPLLKSRAAFKSCLIRAQISRILKLNSASAGFHWQENEIYCHTTDYKSSCATCFLLLNLNARIICGVALFYT